MPDPWVQYQPSQRLDTSRRGMSGTLRMLATRSMRPKPLSHAKSAQNNILRRRDPAEAREAKTTKTRPAAAQSMRFSPGKAKSPAHIPSIAQTTMLQNAAQSPSKRFLTNSAAKSQDGCSEPRMLQITQASTWIVVLQNRPKPIAQLVHAPSALLRKPNSCLLYTSPSPRDRTRSRMPSSA